MSLQFYNTLTRKKEPFKPITGKKVNLFVCGPTVYDHSHIGHLKTYVCFDVIVKYLRYKKYDVFYLQNITDIDDRIIRRSEERKKDFNEIAEKYEKSYHEDMEKMGIDSVNEYARATDHIKEIIKQVKGLMEKDFAYEIEDGIYFDLKKFKDYGKLSGRKVVEAEDSVSRIDDSINKRNKGDFCLWKFSKKDEPSWDNPFGKPGRPGWHIEDTAITEKFFGTQYDVHGGAKDLIFPHHEAEIAQMEALSGKSPLVRYWLHPGFLDVKSKKMSKSLGNFITIKDILKRYDPKTLRFFYVSTHYRSPIDFDEENIKSTESALNKINDFIQIAKNSKDNADEETIKNAKKEFLDAMDDDIDTPKAVAVIFNFMREINRKGNGKNVYDFFREIDKIFNVFDFEEKEITKEEKDLIEKREEARKNNDFELADRIRKQLREKGIILEDTNKGARWKRQR